MVNLKQKAWELKVSWQGSALKFKEKLNDWQWLPAEHAAELQQRRLERLLRHCYAHVPYYKPLLERYGVVDEAGCVQLDRFTSLPLLDKATINAQFEQLKSEDLAARSWFVNSSGGSTGVPVQLIQDKDYSEWSIAVKMLDDEWSGMHCNQRRAYVWGSVRDALVGKETMRTHLGRWIRNELWLNSFRMSQEQMDGFVRKLNEFRPVQILAFAENIYELARYIEQSGQAVHPPKSVMTSAGVLYPHMRETIERVFNAPVFNRYGSREVGDMACECSHHQGLHISAHTHLVEILRSDGSPAAPGEYGEIAVTLLTNYAMPLVRYRIGDMGVMSPEPCSCGRGLPLLKEIVGRTSDIFINRRGERIDGRMFIRMLMTQPFIRKFQVVQEDYDKLSMRLVPTTRGQEHSRIYAGELAGLTADIRTLMGDGCDVRFEFVDEIEATNSGKYRFTISKVQPI